MNLLIRILSLVLLAGLAVPVLATERVLLTPGGTTDRAKTAAMDIAALMRMADEKGTVKVVVGLRVPFAADGTLKPVEAREQRADIARAASGFRTRMAVAIGRNPAAFRSFESIPFAAVEVTPAELRQLAADPEVISIVQNKTYKTQLALSIPMVRANEAWSAGFSGKGQTIAIIDTGVDKTHPFLAGKVVAEGCFSEGGWCPNGATMSTAPGSGMPCPQGDCLHGTHVAGIAAGQGTNFSGVARDAKIIAIQAFGPDTFGGTMISMTDALSAIDYVYSLRSRFAIASVNMSFAGIYDGPEDCDAQTPAMAAALANLRSAAIAPVIASGNNFLTNRLAEPACLSRAVSVGAVATKDWGNCVERATYGSTARDKVACFSNSSPKLSLLAPGLTIQSSITGGGFASHPGTSMAAPHVAGAWAVLKQKKPNASVDEILAVLQKSGVPVEDHRNGRRTSRIDVKAALDELGGSYRVLGLTKDGSGTGTVRFSPAAGSSTCSSSCPNSYPVGTTVTLSAQAAPNSEFAGWSGACNGTAASCTVTMSEARSVTATFKRVQLSLTYTKQGNGGGSVTFRPQGGPPITCSASCTNSFDYDTVIVVEPSPAPGSIFGEWTGPCRLGEFCRFSLRGATTLTASFQKTNGAEVPLTVEMAGPGGGQVRFVPPGNFYTCDRNCVSSYRPNSAVSVYVQEDNRSRFTGWTGACTDDAHCMIEMNEAKKIVANFAPAILTLSYAKTGNGSGTVFLSPKAATASCSTDCVNSYEWGTVVTLTASPQSGSVFKSWLGKCSGTAACTITMDKASYVSAVFETVSEVKRPIIVQRVGKGQGSVSFASNGEVSSCVPDCSQSFPAGADVTLTAKPSAGTVFKGWTGDCTGTSSCTVAMNKDIRVGVSFEQSNSSLLPLNYTPSGAGSGTVRFTTRAGSTECRQACVNTFAPGTTVRVSISGTDLGSVMGGWTGACRNKGRCVIKMRKPATLGATFNRVPIYDLNYAKAGNGEGTISFSTGGTPCDASCTQRFQQGQRVTLRAKAKAGSLFTGWTGACKGKKTCKVTMTGARSVTATFRLR